MDKTRTGGHRMNHKLLNKTLKKVNRELRVELKRKEIELFYVKSLLKLSEKEKK